MILLALLLSLCGLTADPPFHNAPPELRDLAPILQRAEPVHIPTIGIYPDPWLPRIET